MGCGCNKAKAVQPLAQQQVVNSNKSISSVPSLEGQVDTVKVIYKGPAAYTHMIGSPTGIIRELYGMQSYGLGKQGDVLFVHKKDLEQSPWLYEVVTDSKVDNPNVQEIANELAVNTLANASPEPSGEVTTSQPSTLAKAKVGKTK